MALEHKGEFQVEYGFGLPLKTTAERTAYTPPQDGYQVFDTELNKIFVYANTAWHEVANSDGAAGVNSRVSKAGDTMTGPLILSGDPTDPLGAVTKSYVDTEISTSEAQQLNLSGGTMTGDIAMGGNEITGLPAVPSATGATSKEYVDSLATNYATASQGSAADTALQPGDSINELGDVDTATVAPANGQALVWDGTNFVPTDVSVDLTGYVTLDTAQTITGSKTFNNVPVNFNDAGAKASFQISNTEVAFIRAEAITDKGTLYDYLTVSATERFAVDAGDQIDLIAPGEVNITGGTLNSGANIKINSIPSEGIRLSQNGGSSATINADLNFSTRGRFIVSTAGLNSKDVLVIEAEDLTNLPPVAVFDAKVQSTSTVTGDSATTLTTKDYVDGLVTGNDTLEELNDVTITSADSGDFLRHDGSAWVDHVLVAADITDGSTTFATFAQGALADSALQNINSQSIDELSDVDTTTVAPTNGDVLGWDGTNFVPTDVSVDLTNYVTLDGVQTISGEKTFSGKAKSASTIGTDDATTLTTKDYVDQAITTGATLSTDDLTDVDTSTTAPANGHALFFNGTNFVNRLPVAADISDGATTFATFAQGALADSAVQPGDATSTLTNNDAFVDLTTAQTVAGVKTFSDDINANGNLTVAGDLVVSGTTTSVNTTNTEITDSIITLNKGESGAGVTNPNQSGLEIDRGTEANKFLIWSESNDKFGQADVDGNGDVDVPTFKAFALADDVANSSYIAAFNTGDWTAGTPNTYTVLQATHGVPVSDIYDVTVFEGSSKVSIEVTVNASGDVTLTTTGAVFTGKVKISL